MLQNMLCRFQGKFQGQVQLINLYTVIKMRLNIYKICFVIMYLGSYSCSSELLPKKVVFVKLEDVEDVISEEYIFFENTQIRELAHQSTHSNGFTDTTHYDMGNYSGDMRITTEGGSEEITHLTTDDVSGEITIFTTVGVSTELTTGTIYSTNTEPSSTNIASTSATISTTTTSTTTTTARSTTTPYEAIATIYPVVIFNEYYVNRFSYLLSLVLPTNNSNCDNLNDKDVLSWLKSIWTCNDAPFPAEDVKLQTYENGCEVEYSVDYNVNGAGYDEYIDVSVRECLENVSDGRGREDFNVSYPVNKTATEQDPRNDEDALLAELDDFDCSDVDCGSERHCVQDDSPRFSCRCNEYGSMPSFEKFGTCLSGWIFVAILLVACIIAMAVWMVVISKRTKNQIQKVKSGRHLDEIPLAEDQENETDESEIYAKSTKGTTAMAYSNQIYIEDSEIDEVISSDIGKSEAFKNFEPSIKTIADHEMMRSNTPFQIKRPNFK